MLGILLAISIRALRAEEGFFATPPPAPLTKAWDATVLLYTGTTDKIGVASAVVVRRQGDEVDLLTANHAVTSGCGKSSCDQIRVFRSVRIEWGDRNKVKLGGIGTSLKVIARDAGADLALLRLRTKETFDPIQIAATCPPKYATTYAIGYPVTADRKDVVKITEPALVQRRWSVGHALNRASSTESGSIFFGKLGTGREVIATSADAMPGNSGGPLVNEDGVMMGLINLKGEPRADGNYHGRDKSEALQINAIATPCEVVHKFVTTAPER